MPEILKNYDSFLNGTMEQNLQIVKKMHPKYSVEERKYLLNQITLRGGLFWSDRKNSIIAGKLSDGNRLDFKTFYKKLIITIKNN